MSDGRYFFACERVLNGRKKSIYCGRRRHFALKNAIVKILAENGTQLPANALKISENRAKKGVQKVDRRPPI